MGTKISSTSSVLRTKAAIEADGIVVSDPLKWLTILVEPEKRICSYFDDCVILFYECMFTRMGFGCLFLILR